MAIPLERKKNQGISNINTNNYFGYLQHTKNASTFGNSILSLIETSENEHTPLAFQELSYIMGNHPRRYGGYGGGQKGRTVGKQVDKWVIR